MLPVIQKYFNFTGEAICIISSISPANILSVFHIFGKFVVLLICSPLLFPQLLSVLYSNFKSWGDSSLPGMAEAPEPHGFLAPPMAVCCSPASVGGPPCD